MSEADPRFVPGPGGEAEGDRHLDRLIDDWFDRPSDASHRAELLRRLRANADESRRLARLDGALRSLKDPLRVPDQRRDILRRVGRTRGFVDGPLRRLVQIGRVAAAVALGAGLLGIALTQRWAPEATRLVAAPAPVSKVVAQGHDEAVASLAVMTTSLGTLGRDLFAPVSEAMEEGRALRMTLVVAQEPELPSLPRLETSPGAADTQAWRGHAPTTAAGLRLAPPTVLPLGHVSATRVGTIDWSSTDPARNPFILPPRPARLDWDPSPRGDGSPQVVFIRGW